VVKPDGAEIAIDDHFSDPTNCFDCDGESVQVCDYIYEKAQVIAPYFLNLLLIVLDCY
jgi:hypothetical protein